MELAPQSIRLKTSDGVSLNFFRYRDTISPQDEAHVPVVLLHGGGANAHWWDHIAEPLAHTFSEEATLYTLDFRGHGDSEFPDQHEVGAFGLDLASLVASFGREDVILIGHSMGAAVALDHTSRFPATRGLVLVDLARGRSKGSRRKARLALSFRRTYPTRKDAIARYQFLPESSHASESLRASIARHSVQEEPDGRFGYKFDPAWFALPPSPPADLSKVRCPTLLIRGAESNLISEDSASEFISQIEKGEDIALAHAGHHVMLDQPEAFIARIIETLKPLLRSTDAQSS
ncbi:MAG: alpha/beta fold hydrolase [Myxococcota bacterium]